MSCNLEILVAAAGPIVGIADLIARAVVLQLVHVLFQGLRVRAKLLQPAEGHSLVFGLLIGVGRVVQVPVLVELPPGDGGKGLVIPAAH